MPVKRRFAGLSGVLAAVALVMLAPLPVVAQTSTTYTPPRTREGQPDLQGIWQVLNTAAWDVQDHGASLGAPAGQGVVEGNEIPYQPWALAKKQENFRNRRTADPETKCYEPGVPRITYMPYPFQIVQTPEYIAILYEYIHVTRHIYVCVRRSSRSTQQVRIARQDPLTVLLLENRECVAGPRPRTTATGRRHDNRELGPHERPLAHDLDLLNLARRIEVR